MRGAPRHEPRNVATSPLSTTRSTRQPLHTLKIDRDRLMMVPTKRVAQSAMRVIDTLQKDPKECKIAGLGCAFILLARHLGDPQGDASGIAQCILTAQAKKHLRRRCPGCSRPVTREAPPFAADRPPSMNRAIRIPRMRSWDPYHSSGTRASFHTASPHIASRKADRIRVPDTARFRSPPATSRRESHCDSCAWHRSLVRDDVGHPASGQKSRRG
jgi:hypothetical protein